MSSSTSRGQQPSSQYNRPLEELFLGCIFSRLILRVLEPLYGPSIRGIPICFMPLRHHSQSPLAGVRGFEILPLSTFPAAPDSLMTSTLSATVVQTGLHWTDRAETSADNPQRIPLTFSKAGKGWFPIKQETAVFLTPSTRSLHVSEELFSTYLDTAFYRISLSRA